MRRLDDTQAYIRHYHDFNRRTRPKSKLNPAILIRPAVPYLIRCLYRSFDEGTMIEHFRMALKYMAKPGSVG